MRLRFLLIILFFVLIMISLILSKDLNDSNNTIRICFPNDIKLIPKTAVLKEGDTFEIKITYLINTKDREVDNYRIKIIENTKINEQSILFALDFKFRVISQSDNDIIIESIITLNEPITAEEYDVLKNYNIIIIITAKKQEILIEILA